MNTCICRQYARIMTWVDDSSLICSFGNNFWQHKEIIDEKIDQNNKNRLCSFPHCQGKIMYDTSTVTSTFIFLLFFSLCYIILCNKNETKTKFHTKLSKEHIQLVYKCSHIDYSQLQKQIYCSLLLAKTFFFVL